MGWNRELGAAIRRDKYGKLESNIERYNDRYVNKDSPFLRRSELDSVNDTMKLQRELKEVWE